MSLLGRILAVLVNVAAAAFFVVAVMAFTRQQNWSHSIVALDRQLEGEPIDKTETDLHGNAKVEDFSERTLKELPTLEDGKPLTNQEEELHRVEARLREKISGTTELKVRGLDKPLQSKEQRLAWALRPLAITFARRDALFHVMQEKEPRLQDALGIFGKNFDSKLGAELKKLQAQGLEDKDEEERQRRKIIAAAIPDQLAEDFDETFSEVYKINGVMEKRGAIAWLLLGLALGEDDTKEPAAVLAAPAFSRTLVVIGQTMMNEQLERQVGVLKAMAYECERTMECQRDLFVQQHHARLLRVLALQETAEHLKKQAEAKKDEIKLQKQLIEEQEKEIAAAETQLREARAETARLLEQKTAAEIEILKQLRKLRAAVESIQQLAADLRKLEEQFPRREAEPR